MTVELLTGATPRSKRRQLLDDLANGSLKVLVGTHALLEDPVVFSRLGLVVVDEQHRFGVHQRDRLLNKGLQPHLLTMTATPIPRTLALSLHGDLDVSQIDELPPGRTPIRTAMLTAAQRSQAYELIREEVGAANGPMWCCLWWRTPRNLSCDQLLRFTRNWPRRCFRS